MLAHEQCPEDVGGELALDFGLGHRVDRTEAEDTRIVDNDVGHPESDFRGLEQSPHLLRLRDIGLYGDRPATGLGDCLDGPIGGFAVRRIVDHYRRASGRERLGDTGADAL